MLGYIGKRLPRLNSRERNQLRNEGHNVNMTLGKNIKQGHKIKTSAGWRKVLEVNEDGVLVKEGLIKFGANVYGWKVS